MTDPGMGRFYQADGDAGSGGGKADAGGKGAGTGTDDAGKVKTFSEEQVNSIVSKRVGEVQTKFSDELKTAREQMAAMQSQLDQRKIVDAEGQKQYEEAKRLREEGFAKELAKERQAREQAETRYRDTAITQAITASAAGLKATKPDQVVALLKDSIKFDDTGTPRFNDGSSIEDGVKKFLGDNPHMVQAGGRQGSGATGGASGMGAVGLSLEGKTIEQIRAMNPADVVRAARATQKNPFIREG